MDNRNDTANTAPMDPVALTLALWLGLLVGTMGVQRLSENAARQAALAQANAPAAPASDTQSPFSVQMMAFGG